MKLAKRTIGSPITALAAALLAASLVAAAGANPPEGPPAPPPRDIPGINAPDRFAGACVDCHIDMPAMKMDVRISTLMQKWTVADNPKLIGRARQLAADKLEVKGNHPRVPGMLDDIPASCIQCHDNPSSKTLPFAGLMHVIHLRGVNDGHFMSIFQGECTHCHKIDLQTGLWRVPSGPEKGNGQSAPISSGKPGAGPAPKKEGASKKDKASAQAVRP